MKNSDEKKLSTNRHIGPGGMNCNCCGPAPGKERKAFLRAAKRRLKQFHRKLIKSELKDMDP